MDGGVRRCTCHDEPMVLKSDGYWRCVVKIRAKGLRCQRRYEQSLRGRMIRRRYDLRKLRVRVMQDLENLKGVLNDSTE